MHVNIDKGLLQSILTMGSVIEARDAYTGGHIWRVSRFSELLAEKAGLSQSEIFLARLGGYVHDLGKVGVPDQILNKPSGLDRIEFGIMKNHPLVGRELLVQHPLSGLVLDAVSHHHEKIDGSGYPEGLTGDRLSVFAKIISIADALDAMTSTRSYRRGMSKKRAIAILEQEKGSHFSTYFVDKMCDLAADQRLDHVVGHSDVGRPMVNCPMCGPVIAVPGNKLDGDIINCNSCKGIFQLHAKANTFELEFKHDRNAAAKPEIDLEQITDMVKKAPEKVGAIENEI